MTVSRYTKEILLKQLVSLSHNTIKMQKLAFFKFIMMRNTAWVISKKRRYYNR